MDVDAFFPSVEQLLIPRLRGRPVAVGSGCVASCSYEARRLGLHAGMALGRARQLCPELVILAGQQAIYRCFAEQIWEICRRYTDTLETFLDEAYGEVGSAAAFGGGPAALGREIQSLVREEAGLSVSIGLGANRMLAKLATRSVKPGGVRWIAPGEANDFLTDLPIDSLLGVGPKTAAMMGDLNIATVGQLRRLSREALAAMLGRRGEWLYERCRGRDIQPGKRTPGRKLPKTISRETTFHQPLCDGEQIRAMLQYLLERAMRTVRQEGLQTRTVELSIRYDDWKAYAARRSLAAPTTFDGEVLAVVYRLFDRLHTRRVALRTVGVVLSGLTPADRSPTLFDRPGETRARNLYDAVDAIRSRWGHAAVIKGDSINLLGTLERNDHGFVLRTPSLTK